LFVTHRVEHFRALSNKDLESALSVYPQFRGVFSKDMLPQRINSNEIGVVNLDDFGGGGTHWVCYFNTSQGLEKDHVIYFDSYGLSEPEEVKKYLETSGKQIKYSSSEIQEFGSVMCGYYCIYVLNQLMKGYSFYDILYQFTHWPSESNEVIIKNLFS